VDATEHAVAAPFPEVVVDRGVRRKVLRQLPPLAAGAIDVANGVENLAHVGGATASTWTRRREHRLDDGPLLVADVAWIATAARLASRDDRQSTWQPPDSAAIDRITGDSYDSRTFKTGSKILKKFRKRYQRAPGRREAVTARCKT
jgi:hypothetical protein